MPPKKAASKPSQRTTASNVKKPSGNVTAKKSGTNTGGKKSTPASGKSAQKEAKKEVKKGPTPQDLAAIKIQTIVRGFLAKKQLKRLRQEKKLYDETIENIQREAFIAMVKAEQEAVERELAKEEEERKRKREELKRRKRMLEAAFDGDVDEMENILKEVSDLDHENGVANDDIGRIVRRMHQMAVVECEDANDNTPLSEAGSGGNVEAITFLIQRGANPNTIGAWGRTPLYRAAFSGHMEAVECLLQFGADPRIYAHDGNTPEQVASVKQIIETLQNWDISITQSLLEKMESEKERRAEEMKKKKEAETNKLQGELSEIEKMYESKQHILQSCYTELEKRIHVHDKAVQKGFEQLDATLASVKDAEGDLEIAKMNAMKAREELEQAKLRLREQAHDDTEELPGMKCNIRELDEVLVRDVGNRIRDSGKWPMLIDPTGQASTFLRYRDTNYLCALNPQQMQEETIRKGLLGALRFGKPFVVDMLEVDMFSTVTDIFNRIEPELMDDILSREILKEEKTSQFSQKNFASFVVPMEAKTHFRSKLTWATQLMTYMKLVQPTDADDYQRSKFQHHRVDNFMLVIVTKNKFPPENLLDITYPIRIVLPEK